MKDFLRAVGPASWAVITLCVLLLFVMGWCAATAPGRERAKHDRAVEAANAKARTTDRRSGT